MGEKDEGGFFWNVADLGGKNREFYEGLERQDVNRNVGGRQKMAKIKG